MSSGVEWAMHCCLTLSQARAPVPAARLAELHGVSPSYLAKQLQLLSRAGLVRSTQGQVGGYELTRDAAEVSMLDVVRAIDGPEPAFRCTEIRQRGPLGARPDQCAIPCGIAQAMADAEAAYHASLAGVSIASLAEGWDRKARGRALPAVREWLETPG